MHIYIYIYIHAYCKYITHVPYVIYKGAGAPQDGRRQAAHG